jgi:isopenicillin N synthase-like dioxygenase
LRQVPTLDVRALRGGDAPQFVRELHASLREFGFVCFVGHGVDEAVTEPAYDALRRFFALPEDVKRSYHIPGGGGARGYTAFGVEAAKDAQHPDLKEFWHVGREFEPSSPWRGSEPENIWPRQVPGFQEATLALYRALDELGVTILRAIALGLGLPERFFDGVVDRGNSVLRPIHYPPLPKPCPPGVRAAAHEDINLITLLVCSDAPGLELLNREGQWLPLGTDQGMIAMNVGDMLQRLTNHVLPSTTHRVVNPPEPWASQARTSIPFFLHPNSEYLIRTLPECVTPDNPDRYPEPITADAYLTQRLVEIGLIKPG